MIQPISTEATRAALTHIPANDSGVWVKMGMALKSEFGDIGFDLYDAWSQSAENYDASNVKARWKSFKAGGKVTIASLIAEAKKGGFDPKQHAAAKPLSPAEVERIKQERLQREQAEAVQVASAQSAAAIEAMRIWEAAPGEGVSPYLQRKGIAAFGVRFSGNAVLVPLHDSAGKLWTLQTIQADGTKRLMKGSRVSGCFHVLGNAVASDWVLIAEGYATAATLYKATGFAVAMAVNSTNLRHVVDAIRKLYPSAKLLICADDDQETAIKTGKNPGLLAGGDAAQAVQCMWCAPSGLAQGGTDFNDLAVHAGIDVVATQIMAAIDAPVDQRVDNNLYFNLTESNAVEQSGARQGVSKRMTKQAPKVGSKDAANNKRKPGENVGDGIDGYSSQPFFNVNEKGVWIHRFDQEGNPMRPFWICSELRIIAETRDATNGEWGYLLSFADADGNPKRWAMPANMLATDGAAYRSILLAMGLKIGAGTTAKNQLHAYIQSEKTNERVRCVERIGWHGNAYALPDRTIGDGDEKIMFQSVGGVVSQFKQRGTLEEWRENVAKHCQGNARMAFCVSAAFAAPLLHLAGIQSAGFHIWGDSSTGKSTAVRVAASVYGGKDYARNWRMTDNALETVAVQHSDALLVLDEIAQVDPKVVGDVAYMLANETGKGRATQTATAKKVSTWRLLFLSDGEVSLAQHMAQAGKTTKGGHDVRVIHVTADAGKGLGIYDTTHGFADGAVLSKHIGAMANQYYGVAGLAFIEAIAGDAESIKDGLRQGINERVAELVPRGAHGQVSRVAELFALVALAGEMASNMGMTGWAAGEATDAARTCFDDWLTHRGGTGNTEHSAIIRQVSAFFQIHGDSRFVWWHRAMDDHKPNTINRAGFKRMISRDGTPINFNADHGKEFGDRMHPEDATESTLEYYVLPGVFREEICKGYNPKAVAKLLCDRKLLVTSGSGDGLRPDKQVRLPGMGKMRCFQFNPEIASAEA